MLEEEAKVVSAEGDFITVEVVRQSACGTCSAKAGCGVEVVSRIAGSRVRTMTLQVRNTIGAEVGDHVIVAVPDAVMVKSSMLVYITPLVLMVLGAILAESLGGPQSRSDLLAVIGAVAGFVMGLAIVRGLGQHMSRRPEFQAVTLRKYIPVGTV